MSKTSMEEYLKKYMSPADGGATKKKRKKKKVLTKSKVGGIKIFDDDVSVDQITVHSDEEDQTKYMTMEEKPQIVTDDQDAYNDVTKWKTFGAKEEEDESVIVAGPSKTRRRKRHDSDSDMDIPRSKPSRKRHDSDSSNDTKRKKKSKRHDSDSDMEVPRQKEKSSKQKRQNSSDAPSQEDSDLDVPRGGANEEDEDSDLDDIRAMSSTKTSKKMQDGGIGGLISLAQHRAEIANNKKKESNLQKLAEQFKNSETIGRERGTGELRNMTEEKRLKEEKELKKLRKMEQYAKWGQGLKQAEMHEEAVKESLYEESKPLARYRDDEDLDKMLRDEIREDEDPMAKYILSKREKLRPKDPSKPAFPKYVGPPPAPNRYNIMPGYRWDGVDRSNGFESRYYTNISDRAAEQRAYHQWSVNDM